MSVWDNVDHLNCRVFSSSLGDLPLKWFCALPEGSISSWRQLRDSFVERFQVHMVIPKSNADLLAIKMRWTETTTQFVRRFWTVYSQIEDANDEVAIMCFRQALLPGNELRKDLAQSPVVTVKALMARVNQFIEQEADEARAQQRRNDDQESDESQGYRTGGQDSDESEGYETGEE